MLGMPAAEKGVKHPPPGPQGLVSSGEASHGVWNAASPAFHPRASFALEKATYGRPSTAFPSTIGLGVIDHGRGRAAFLTWYPRVCPGMGRPAVEEGVQLPCPGTVWPC